MKRFFDEPIMWAVLLIWVTLSVGIIYLALFCESQPVQTTKDLTLDKAEKLLLLWTTLGGALIKTWLDKGKD